MEELVEQKIAQVGACGIGKGGGDMGLVELCEEFAAGEGGEVRIGAVWFDGCVGGLVSFGIRDAKVCEIDGNAFDADGGSSSQTKREDGMGLRCF